MERTRCNRLCTRFCLSHDAAARRKLIALAGDSWGVGMLAAQVRYLQGQIDRLKEKAAQAERSAAASLAQKVCLVLWSLRVFDLGWDWQSVHDRAGSTTV